MARAVRKESAWWPQPQAHRDGDDRIEEIIITTARGEAGERYAPEHAQHSEGIGHVGVDCGAAAPHGDVQTLDSLAGQKKLKT
jgi:hypothetical protein